MKNLILFDDDTTWKKLQPLTHTRPISELRVGILTIKEKWEKILDATASYVTQEYLSKKFPIVISNDNLLVNSALLPNTKLTKLIEDLELNEAIMQGQHLIAARLSNVQFDTLIRNNEVEEIQGIDVRDQSDLITFIEYPYHIFEYNARAIIDDFSLLTKGRPSAPIAADNRIIGDENKVFIEEGANVRCSILNTTEGPIYIGRDAEVMEGSIIRGPFALCDHSIVKMGSKIYPGVTVGPWSKLGGEAGHSVILGYSNKGHEGYLGNSVLGEWCNLGADTNTSNLKNNYDDVKVWSYVTERFEKTGLTFHGLIMADHSKCGINTMFNTGTVVGISANIFGEGYPRNFIPSFAWGGKSGWMTYQFDKAIDTAEKVMARRKMTLSDEDKDILQYIFDQSAKYRTWDK